MPENQKRKRSALNTRKNQPKRRNVKPFLVKKMLKEVKERKMMAKKTLKKVEMIIKMQY